jgi:fructosamine-3-kinase
VTVFTKTRHDAPPGFFAAEAAGLERLRPYVPVPDVLDVARDRIVLSWIEPGTPTTTAAEELGRGLARLHASGAEWFGGQWFGGGGWIATLPLDPAPATSWPRWYAERRLVPFLASVDGDDRRAVERVIERIESLAGPDEAPRPLHGDLWGGNVVWSAGGPAYLIDPSFHAGHRETDLAMLALFGAPHLDRVLAAYDEASPLADGWRDRVPLHQLYPLLVHATLFGGSYRAQAGDAARACL